MTGEKLMQVSQDIYSFLKEDASQLPKLKRSNGMETVVMPSDIQLDTVEKLFPDEKRRIVIQWFVDFSKRRGWVGVTWGFLLAELRKRMGALLVQQVVQELIDSDMLRLHGALTARRFVLGLDVSEVVFMTSRLIRRFLEYQDKPR